MMGIVLVFSIFLHGIKGSDITMWDPVAQVSVPATPDEQHIPEDPLSSHLRPPRPMMPRHSAPSIFIGISSFRDGKRCGNTLYTIFSNAEDAARVVVGVVDQRAANEQSCLAEYCTLAKKNKYMATKGVPVNETFTTSNMEFKECPHIHQIRILEKTAEESKGPCVARSWQQALVDQEDFCLQVDAHSVFMEHWDSMLINDWLKADNEMAILSTYINDYNTYTTWDKSQHPHLCKTGVGLYDMVRNDGASIVGNINQPQLSSLWGAGLSFGKCHAEKRVPLDPLASWIFDGEEFMKSSRLWTAGYDIYTPSVFPIYHDYSPVPHRFEMVEMDPVVKEKERNIALNRMKLIFGLPVVGSVKADDIEYYQMDTVRSFQHYLNYSGINLKNRSEDLSRCHQLHWEPFEKPESVTALLQSQLDKQYDFYPPYVNGFPEMYALELKKTKSLREEFQDGDLQLVSSGTVFAYYSAAGLTLLLFFIVYIRLGRRNKKAAYRE